ncbi:hypothetical protein [Leifsonia sp. NPDC080035]|uniref:HEAT repeat domain-containing protein n=1 Tax=Leifsonia sp. NPDC080035 TaxID=3143936 RepID=A0AAU7G9M3_9MICO
MPPLADLLSAALHGDRAALETALAADSRLPGPRANLELAHRFADVAAARPAEDRDALLALLTDWLASPPRFSGAVPEGAAEFLPATAALAAGAIGEVPLLDVAAADPRWRVRELAATGMQRVLAADWRAGVPAVRAWLRSGDPLRVRAAVAAVAEPPLLKDPAQAAEACGIVEDAADLLLAVPAEHRRDDDVRVLRQALGYAVSVVAAAHPDAGIPVLERLATSSDADARWIAKQNLSKARISRFADRLAVARDAVSRA